MTQPCTILLALCLFALLCSCKPSSSALTSGGNETVKDERNNLLSVDSDNTNTQSSSTTEIVFEGTNNLFELVQRNSAYFDESHDVIIIKGNNIIVRLINVNVLELPGNSSDTLIIVGDNEKYVIDVNGSILINDRSAKTDVVYLKDKSFDQSAYAADFVQNEKKIRLDYFDSLVSARYAYTYFSEKLSTGDPVYFYQLAEMYLYGLGVNESSTKAIELYEYAAVRNHVQSLTKLGDIFTGKFGVKKNKDKSLYYYKRCSELGNQYCDDQIAKLLNK